MAFNDKHRQKIVELVKDEEFLTLLRAAKSNDELYDITNERFGAYNIPAKIDDVQALPAGFGSGFRLKYFLADQGLPEQIDFDQDQSGLR